MKRGGRIVQILLLIAGCVAVALGILGLFLPVLPTTPFMLLAAYCFCRSSQRLYIWLMSHPVFGFKLYSYRVTHGMTLRAKWQVWIFLWLSIGLSMMLVPSWWLRALLFLVALSVTAHIAHLSTITDEVKESHYEAYIRFRQELKARKREFNHL